MKIRTEIDSKGYIRLRINLKQVDGTYKPKTMSTGIKLERVSDFDKEREKVRATVFNYKKLNDLISEKEKEFEKELKKLANAPAKGDSIITLWNKFIAEQLVFGTAQRYKSSLIKFKEFLSFKEIEDVTFDMVNHDFLMAYKKWLYTRKKANAAITNEKDLSTVKTMCNQAIERNIYKWEQHPFKHIKIEDIETNKERLNKNEFADLLKLETQTHFKLIKQSQNNIRQFEIDKGIEPLRLEINDKIRARKLKELKNKLLRIEKNRNKFVLQVFFSGIRIKDYVSIKWNSFKQSPTLTLKYVTSKTNDLQEVVIPSVAVPYMRNFVVNAIETYLPKSKLTEGLYKEESKPLDQQSQQAINSMIIGMINVLSIHKDTSNKLFLTTDVASNERLKDYDPEKSVESIEKKIHSLTAVYNGELKEMAEFADINIKKFSSHTARHTFSTYMLTNGRNVYDLMKALTHKSLKVTDKYKGSLGNLESSATTAQMFDDAHN